MEEETETRYKIVFIVSSIIFVLYAFLMIALFIKRKLFLSANVLIWSYLILFFIKALADGLRLLKDGFLSTVYYDIS